jgi:hypothetical protein
MPPRSRATKLGRVGRKFSSAGSRREDRSIYTSSTRAFVRTLAMLSARAASYVEAAMSAETEGLKAEIFQIGQ